MLRADAMRRDRPVPVRRRATTNVLAHTDLVGKVATRAAPLMNRMIGGDPDPSPARSSRRPRGCRHNGSSRRSRRSGSRPGSNVVRASASSRQGRVAASTCLVEYQEPAIGQDLVKVYERNGIECSITADVGCCGAPWLHSGDVEHFTKVATKNVKALAKRAARQ